MAWRALIRADAPPPIWAANDPLAALSDVAFLKILESGSLQAMEAACKNSIAFGLDDRLRLLRARLLERWPSPQSYELVMANASVLIECRAPSAAFSVLSRYGPAAGPRREAWLILRWRAADGALDHRRAALALHRLVEGDLSRLDGVLLPIRRNDDGTWSTRAATDVLADHYEAMSLPGRASAVLLAGRAPGAVAARRLARAAGLMENLAMEERVELMERALDQAALDQAWGLALELLVLQELIERGGGGGGSTPRQRRERLSRRLGDVYSEWRLLADDPEAGPRLQELLNLLRSPRETGGHASPGTPRPPPPPPSPPVPIQP